MLPRILALFFAVCCYLFGIYDEKVNFTDNDLVRQRVFRRNRVLLVVSRLEHLLPWNLENFEQDLDQIWTVEVVEVLLTKVSLIPCLHPCNNHGLASF